jgi:hypothetical protein
MVCRCQACAATGLALSVTITDDLCFFQLFASAFNALFGGRDLLCLALVAGIDFVGLVDDLLRPALTFGNAVRGSGWCINADAF